MKEGIVFDAIHQGVPANTVIQIYPNEIISLCAQEKEAEKAIDDATAQVKNFLSQFVSGKYAKEILMNDLRHNYAMNIIPEEDSTEKKIIFSPYSLLIELLLDLRKEKKEEIELTFENMIRVINERMYRLKKVRGEKALKESFPELYEKYSQKRKMGGVLQKTGIIARLQMTPPMLRGQVMMEFARRNNLSLRDVEILLESSTDLSVPEFVEAYLEMTSSLMNNMPEIMSFFRQYEVDLSSLKTISQRKLELYLAHCYLTEIDTFDVLDKQSYLYYVSSYFFTHAEEINDSLKIEVDGKSITPKNLYERYKQVLVKHPDLRMIDFTRDDFEDMSLEEVEKFMEKYLKDLNVNWDFLLPDSDTADKEVLRQISEVTAETEEEKERKKAHLLEMFMEKKTFFDSSDPLYRIKGKKTFNGYIGYIYPNGKVVLDRFFDNEETGKIAEGNAIYVMDLKDFYNLSQLSKTALMRNSLCKRFVHRGHWQERVKKEIEYDKEKPENAVHQMIKLAKKGQISSPKN